MNKISIIVAVYNIEKYISRCLDSVIKQKGNDIEILIVDDGSTDKSLDICKKYQKKDKRIKIIHQDNKGLSASRNVGIDNAKGKYFWFIDGDDYIEENSVDIIREYLDKYDIICFGYNKVTNDKTIKVVDKRKCDNICDKYILTNVSVWNKIFKRDLFNKDRFPENCRYNDFYIVPSLAYKTNKIIFINEYLYNYIYRSNSLSKTRKFHYEDFLYCIDNVYNKVKKKYPDAAAFFYINQLLIYRYAKEIRYGEKYEYRKVNKYLKMKCPKYYQSKYFNTSLGMKIYVRLVYYNMILLVKVLTFIKLKMINKFVYRDIDLNDNK